jgi:hypothetical protein
MESVLPSRSAILGLPGWREGPGAVPIGAATWAGIGVIIVSGGSVRRRSRQAAPRPKLVQFTLTLEEFNEVSQAAERAGMARGV